MKLVYPFPFVFKLMVGLQLQFTQHPDEERQVSEP